MSGFYPVPNYLHPSQSMAIKTPRILISHSSLDKDFCDVFVELLVAMGFTRNTIIYTSKSEFAVPLSTDIYEYLRQNLEKRSIWVFFMLSHNFYKSAACQNEMGAAWVKQSKYFSVLLPAFKHTRRKGVINLNKQTLDLCDPVRLTELLKLFRSKWKLPINDIEWVSVQNEFIEKFKKLYS
jgi:hypothetical protein